jgi:hypothetical protein
VVKRSRGSLHSMFSSRYLPTCAQQQHKGVSTSQKYKEIHHPPHGGSLLSEALPRRRTTAHNGAAARRRGVLGGGGQPGRAGARCPPRTRPAPRPSAPAPARAASAAARRRGGSDGEETRGVSDGEETLRGIDHKSTMMGQINNDGTIVDSSRVKAVLNMRRAAPRRRSRRTWAAAGTPRRTQGRA